MAHTPLQQRIVSQYRGKQDSRYQPGSTAGWAWQTLTPQKVVGLLEAVSTRPQDGADGPSTWCLASQLLRDMGRTGWVIKAALPQSGKDGVVSRDESLQLTVKVGAVSYQLQCKSTPTLHITRITEGPLEA